MVQKNTQLLFQNGGGKCRVFCLRNLGLKPGGLALPLAILRFVLILQSQIFQHGGQAENFEVFKFQSQKCFWSKSKSRHGCYNPQRIVCNHLKLWIS